MKELDIRGMFGTELIFTANLAIAAKVMGISGPDANMLKREALDYAQKFGDRYVNIYQRNT